MQRNDTMDYVEINKRIEELAKSGQYDETQLNAIKYAYYMPNFDATIIIDPSIPGNIMSVYTKLAKNNIDISKYIDAKWHLKGFNAEQLYYLISYDSKGYDISQITPDMDIDEIKDIMNNKIKEKEL